LKRQKLIITDSLEDATFLGILSALKAYQLAWLINQNTTLKLTKVADSHLEIPGHTAQCTAHFLFKTENCTYRLIQNRVVAREEDGASYLIPSLKHFDFFFAVKDFTKTFDTHEFCSALRATKRIAYIVHIDLAICKNRARQDAWILSAIMN